jgi:hypothetical protein
MYQRFKPGQDVSIHKPGFGGPSKYDHTLTVARLAGAAVILSDGSRWRQDGGRWGDKSYSSVSDYIMDRADALRCERSETESRKIRENIRHWKDATSALAKILPVYHKAEAEAALVELLAWVRALPEERGDG